MSGFSADWLALREPADHAARSARVLAAVTGACAGRERLSVLDLGCGAGSNLRGLALSLPARTQGWTLVDHDPALLAVAGDRLAAWAEEANRQGEELLVGKLGKTLAIDFRRLDLTADVERALDWRPDLVTAAALFDLVSEAWIERFVAALIARKLPLYTVLTYDGREEWAPPHPLDGAVHRAFLSHQRRDKGFGPSAGPQAAEIMAQAFRRAGWRVETDDSPWRLTAADAALAGELAGGIASAAAETGAVSTAEAAEWARFRKRSAAGGKARTLVGHIDLFARP